MRLTLSILLLWSAASNAATYYIDWTSGSDANAGTSTNAPWKRMPGMAGFTGSWAAPAGDSFVFKRGDTWPASCFPATMYNSGTTITTNATWGTGSNPVWDYEGAIGVNGAMLDISGSNQVVRGIKFYRTAASGAPNSGRCIRLFPSINTTVDKCIFEPYDSHVIVVAGSGNSVHDGLYITDNDISHAANSIEIGNSGTGTNVFRNVYVTGNHIHNVSDMLVGGDHGDGIHVWSYLVGTYSNLVVTGNRFSGTWKSGDTNTACTAQIYLVPGATDVLVANNVLGYEDTTDPFGDDYLFSPGMMVLGGMTNAVIANNSITVTNFVSAGRGGKAGIVLSSFMDNVRVYNNVFQGMYYAINVLYGATTIPRTNWWSDYNIFDHNFIKVNGVNMGNGTLTNWQTLHGQDLHSYATNVLFASVSTMNLALLTNSPAIDAGTNLTAYFTNDITGAERLAPWDIGAYQFGSEGTPGGGEEPGGSPGHSTAASARVGTLIVR